MAGDINLLENQLSTDVTLRYRSYFVRARMIATILVVISIVLGGGFWLAATLANKSYSAALSAVEQKSGLLNSAAKEKRDKAVALQGELQTLSIILPKHPYWTQGIDAIQSAVIPGVQYMGFSVSAANNVVIINGIARDYDTLAAYSKKLKEAKAISQVVLNTSYLSTIDNASYYRFTVTVTFAPGAMYYQNK